MAATLPFSRFNIPESWVQQCHAKVLAILNAERTRLAFAQLFDGTQIERAAVGMGDLESFLDLQLPFEVTPVAEGFAKEWLANEAARIERNMDVSIVEEAGPPHSYDIIVLAHGFVMPTFRDCVRRFIKERVEGGHSMSGYNFQRIIRDSLTDIEAIQEWTEEFVFGGLLRHSKEDTLEVQPLHLGPFQIPYERAWQMNDLPFRPPPRPQRVRTRLEDDPVLYAYMSNKTG